MRFAVAGATGRTGSAVAEALLGRGHRIRAVVRDAARAEALARRGAEVAVADLRDAVALTEALRGVDGAWLLLPLPPDAPAGRRWQAETTDAIAAAVAAARVPHVAWLSSVGAHVPQGTGPVAGQHRAEQVLRALPHTRCTFVRAAYFVENWAASLGMVQQGVVPGFLQVDRPLDLVAARDVGRIGAEALLEPAAEHRVIEIGGPPATPAEVARVLGELLGRPLGAVEVPLEAVVPTFTGMGSSADVAGLYREMYAAIARGVIGWEGGHPRVRGATPLRDALAALVGRAG